MRIIIRLLVLPLFAVVVLLGSIVSSCIIIWNFIRYGGESILKK